MSVAGETCDRDRFASYVQRNLAWNKYKNGYSLGLEDVAQFVRSTLAEALRSGPYQVNILLGGIDEEGTSRLYWLDYLGTLQEVVKGAHGHAGYFVSSTLTNAYKPGMTVEEGKEAVKACATELRTRYLIDCPLFYAKILTKGKEIEVIEI